MYRLIICLFVLCCFKPCYSRGSDNDSIKIKKTYVIVLHGRYCEGESEVIVKGKYRIKEVCAGCGVSRKVLRKNKIRRRIIKRKFGLVY